MKLERRLAKLTSILDVAKAMTVERDLDALLAMILKETKQTINADRCTIFILDADRGLLWSRIAQGMKKQEIRLPVGQGIAGWVAEHNEILNIPDAYADPRFNRSVDHATGYATSTILCAPMRGAAGELVGVVQALNRKDAKPFDQEDEELVLALGGQAAAAIQNALLNEEIEGLFEGFVKASVVAIESRDPTTSGHSERVALYTCGLAEAVNQVGAGRYAQTEVSVKEMREIRYASLLHDFGKVGVRENVLVKANKLQPYELDLLRARFQLAQVAMERDYYHSLVTLQHSSDSPADDLPLKGNLEQQLAELQSFWSFIEEANRPTVLEQGGFERLQDIAQTRVPGAHGQIELLTGKEVELLSIPRGSLSAEERAEIESHVTHTFRFLTRIPWTRALKRVPEIAYAHHEKLDGRGYPRALGAEQIPLGSRMMTIADIYDALTAQDRPYKRAIPHSRALDILSADAERGMLDKELLQHFIGAKVPEKAVGANNS